MPALSFVTHAARTLYGFEPQSIESLDQVQFDWRGIYRVQDAQDGVWLMRLVQFPEELRLAHLPPVPCAIGACDAGSAARGHDRWMGDHNPLLR
jgi:hypothetical protein